MEELLLLLLLPVVITPQAKNERTRGMSAPRLHVCVEKLKM
jgi:hypothetical protein